MSIPFSVFDFFSYTIPGILYIFTINYLLRILKYPSVNISRFSNEIGYALLGIILAYAIGHLMQTFAWKWYLVFNKDTALREAFNRLKPNFVRAKLNINIEDRQIVVSFLKHNNLKLAEHIDRLSAICVMLHNLSLGLFLFALVQIVQIIIKGFSVLPIVISIAGLILSYTSIKRSKLYNVWYWDNVFEQALHYRKDITAMINPTALKTKRKGSK
jgi:hypothetical protein